MGMVWYPWTIQKPQKDPKRTAPTFFASQPLGHWKCGQWRENIPQFWGLVRPIVRVPTSHLWNIKSLIWLCTSSRSLKRSHRVEEGDRDRWRGRDWNGRERERERVSLRVWTTFQSINGFGTLCHPCVTTTHLSNRFPIFQTSASALRGTNGTSWKQKLRCTKTYPLGFPSSYPMHVHYFHQSPHLSILVMGEICIPRYPVVIPSWSQSSSGLLTIIH